MRIGWVFAKGLKIILSPPALRHCKMSRHTKVCSHSELTGCSIGEYSYLGYYCFMVNAQIGKFCSIADRVCIGGAMHPIHFVSTSPVFHKGKNALHTNFASHQISDTPMTMIGNDVWIGQGAYLKAGIQVADGAVIGMGAVVTKNVGPYEIWAGNPACLIRKRFDDDTIEALLSIKWWDFDDEKLKQYSPLFHNPDAFVSKFVAREECNT